MTVPETRSEARAPAEPGVCESLAPGIRRVVGPNPSTMTSGGTATYLLGEGDVAVIDPGPARSDHLESVLAALHPSERIEAILVTHRHIDHTGSVPALRVRTGAPVYAGRPAPPPHSATIARMIAHFPVEGDGIDRSFRPDILVEPNQYLASTAHRNDGVPTWRVQTIPTPGHLDDHLCFAIEETGALFTGDHVMGWSTSIISPPEGSLAAYMTSLQLLRDRYRAGTDRIYYPGHGEPVPDPARAVESIARARRQRHRAILQVLRDREHGLESLLATVYPGYAGFRAWAARRSLLAHLVEMCARGVVVARIGTDGDYRFALRKGAMSGGQPASP